MISNMPILSIIIWMPIIGGLVMLMLPNKKSFTKPVSLFLSLFVLVLSIILFVNFDSSQYLLQYVEKYVWIKNLDINYHLAVDGFSLVFILLTTSITFLTILYNYSEDRPQDNKYNAEKLRFF